jgi:hypothetical protein
MSPEIYQAFGYAPGETIDVNSTELPLNNGTPVLINLHPLGTLLKIPYDSHYWLVTKNGRAMFADSNYVVSLGYNLARVKPATAPQPDITLESSPFIKGIWYNKAAKAKIIPASYASGVNRDYELGLRPDWFVELQSGAQEFITGGIIDKDTNQINYGLHMYNWALAKQQADGSFQGQTAHSTLFFTAALSRSLIQLQRSPYAGQYANEISAKQVALRRATQWLVSPSIWNETVVKNQELYGHRHFRDATALGLASLATGDTSFMNYAHSELNVGFHSQYPDTSAIPAGYVRNPGPAGSIYELYGFDVGYTGVSIDFASLWLVYFPDDPLTPQVDQMITKAMSYEQSKVVKVSDTMSRLDPTGNSRSCVLSQGPNGELNTPGYASVIHDFAWWGYYKNLPQLVTTAQKLRTYQASGQPLCPPF